MTAVREIPIGEINSIANSQKDSYRRTLYDVANELEALRRAVGRERAAAIRSELLSWEQQT